MKKNILIITLVVSIGVVVAGVTMINSSSKDSGKSAVVEKVDSTKPAENNATVSSDKTENSATNTNNNDGSTSSSSDGSSGVATNGNSTTTTVPTSNEAVSIGIGEEQGAVGSEVVVPVNISEVPQSGIGSCDFKVEFDKATLELVEITPGDVLVNPSGNFSFGIDNNSGTATFLYLDNTFKDEAITKTGAFANLKFKVKDGASGAQEIKVKSIGAFSNNELKTHEVKSANGKVNIN